MKKTKRYYKRFIIYILCTVILMNSIFINRKIESQAAATATVVGSAWLIELLISIGVTYIGYDLVTKLAAPELDDLKEGLLLEPEVESWVNNNKDKNPDEKPNINLPHAVIVKAAEVITRKKDTLVTVSNMFRETGLAVFNRDSSYITQKTALTFKNFGDMDSNAIDSIKGYLKIDYATLAENYYAIPRQNGLLFIPKGCLYIHVLYGVNNKFLANIAITKVAFNTYWNLAINKGAYDAQEFLKANVKDVYLVNTLRGQGYAVTKYNPFVFNNLTAPESSTALTVYGNAENYINGDLVFPTGIGYNQLDQKIDAWWNRSLNISALKPIDTGLEITGDISIPLDPAKYRGIISDQSVAGVRQALYEYGVLDDYVKEITGALDKQTATNQTWFSKIFDKLWEYLQKIINAVISAPGLIVGAINDVGIRLWTWLGDILNAIPLAATNLLEGLSTKFDSLIGAIDLLPSSIADVLPGTSPTDPSGPDDEDPDNPDEDNPDDEPSRSKSFFENLLYLFIYIAMILIKLLQIFIQLYIFIFSIFNIPASTSLLPSDLILGLEYMRSFPLPLFNLTLYQFMTGVLNIILLFSIVALLRRYVFRLRLPKVK